MTTVFLWCISVHLGMTTVFMVHICSAVFRVALTTNGARYIQGLYRLEGNWCRGKDIRVLYVLYTKVPKVHAWYQGRFFWYNTSC